MPVPDLPRGGPNAAERRDVTLDRQPMRQPNRRNRRGRRKRQRRADLNAKQYVVSEASAQVTWRAAAKSPAQTFNVELCFVSTFL